MFKHSKEELKHWCDNCCCIDCCQTKKEKLECQRRLKESPKPSSFGRYELNNPIFVDDELFNQQSIKEHNRLFDKYCSAMKSRFCNNNGFFDILRSRCKVNKKGEIINVEILGEEK